MKRILLSIVVVFLTLPSQAQSNNNRNNSFLRLDLAVGLYTSKDLYSSFQYNTSSVWGPNSKPTIFLSTYFFSIKKIELGAAIGYQNANLEEAVFDINGNNRTAIVDINYYTLMPQIRFNWVQSEDEIFELYSSAGIAFTFAYEQRLDTQENSFSPIPGIHITGMGVRFGRTLGGFMEVGVGSKGFMSAGISYRLD